MGQSSIFEVSGGALTGIRRASSAMRGERTCATVSMPRQRSRQPEPYAIALPTRGEIAPGRNGCANLQRLRFAKPADAGYLPVAEEIAIPGHGAANGIA